MIVCETAQRTREELSRLRSAGRGATLGFVPTMGALHDGHLSLIHAARAECDLAAVSIFVNPTQFGPEEDYRRYPRPLAEDLAQCESAGVDVVLHPDAAEIYQQNLTTVRVEQISEGLCGGYRPDHFAGVALVVAKLLNIVQPDRAYFGQKDAQQLAVVRKMVRDLHMAVEIVGCPTVREADGLALSSRNAYLDGAQRRQATVLYRSLQAMAEAVCQGQREAAAVVRLGREIIERSGPCRIDYVELVAPDTMLPLQRIDGSALAAVAVHIGQCRLIDNLSVDTPAASD